MADKYSRCPNCGAEAWDSTKYCPFCGTLLSSEEEKDSSGAVFEFSSDTSTDNTTETGSYFQTESNNAAQDDFIRRAAAEVTDIRKVDIVAKKPVDMPSNRNSSVIGLIIWIFIGAIVIGNGMVGGVFKVFAIIIFISGLASIIKKVKDASVAPIDQMGRDYQAVVLDHSTSTETILTDDSRKEITVGKVKVLANVGGKETCILIEAGDGHVKSMYPVGCTVKIRGFGEYWMLK